MIVAQPQTYMNRSGIAVSRLMADLGLPTHQLLVIHDDLDLPLGRIRLRPGGGSGGHKGVESIIKHLDSDRFHRLKVGINRAEPGLSVVDYVLQPFAGEEIEILRDVLETAAAAAVCWWRSGVETAMNEFNSKRLNRVAFSPAREYNRGHNHEKGNDGEK